MLTQTDAKGTYDDLGRRTAMGRADGVSSSFTYGSDLRLSGLSHSFVGNSKNQAWGYVYNPAGQLTQSNSSNSAYEWAPTASSLSYTVDGRTSCSPPAAPRSWSRWPG